MRPILKLELMRPIFLLMCLLLALTCNAQLKENFEKGWFINNENVKIEGYIRTDDLSKLSNSICFKRSLDVKECEIYTMTEVKSFQIDNSGTFDLLNFKINNGAQDVRQFLNLIVKGDQLSLYKGVLNSEIFYVLSKKGENYVLQNDKLLSGKTKMTRYHYKGILNLTTEGLAQKSYKKNRFDEDYFVEVVSEYNILQKSKVKDLRTKEKANSFILSNIGIGIENDGFEYYGQLMYRKFLPRISRSLSLNMGVSYFNYQLASEDKSFTQSLLSVPFQIQENILHKKVRPYIFAGFCFNYLAISDENNDSIIGDGFQESYGINLLYGAGIEVDIFKNIYLKGEYRRESYSHPIMFGVGYAYKVK